MPANQKLRRRAVRIVSTLAHVDAGEAEALLEASGGDVTAALARVRRRG